MTIVEQNPCLAGPGARPDALSLAGLPDNVLVVTFPILPEPHENRASILGGRRMAGARRVAEIGSRREIAGFILECSFQNQNFLADVDTNVAGLDLTSAANATTAITTLTTAIDNVGTLNSALGAAANRLDHVYNNLSNISTNVQNATGRIMDVDFATESSSMTSNQMLMQAGTAMLKQTNSMSSMVMSLLQ